MILKAGKPESERKVLSVWVEGDEERKSDCGKLYVFGAYSAAEQPFIIATIYPSGTVESKGRV